MCPLCVAGLLIAWAASAAGLTSLAKRARKKKTEAAPEGRSSRQETSK